MPLTSREKQARYRARHLGVDGTKTAIHLFIEATTKAKLKRLARYKGCTMPALIEEWARRADSRVADRLSGKALKAYYDGE
jgi:predicted DNA-binding ribbon-helix-helix protein